MRAYGTFLVFIFLALRIYAEPVAVDPDQLYTQIEANRNKVAEFAELAALGEKHGFRVFLFGGTAATFANYTKAAMLRDSGDPDFQNARKNFALSSMFKADQDLDIVVTRKDGSPESVSQIESFKNLVATKLSAHRGDHTLWEIRGLKTGHGTKPAIMNNSDFLNQNSDSQSTGLIELTKSSNPGRNVVTDLRQNGSGIEGFLKDTADGVIRFYDSSLHQATSRAISGDNPEIQSVLRTLRKATQFGLEIEPTSLQKMKEIVDRWDPSASNVSTYARKKMVFEATKLITGARNLERALRLVGDIGLTPKLRQIGGPEATENSLNWYLSKTPLPRLHVANRIPAGTTAAMLGISVVTHATPSYEHYLSITSSPDGVPNAFISRSGVVGELAAHGNGYYTAIGKTGVAHRAGAKHYHVVHSVNPNAEYGRDFTMHGDYIIWHNANALRVIVDPNESKYLKPSVCSIVFTRMVSKSPVLQRLVLVAKHNPKLLVVAGALASVFAANAFNLVANVSTTFNTEGQKNEALQLGDSEEQADVAMKLVSMSSYLDLSRAGLSADEALEVAQLGRAKTYLSLRESVQSSHAEILEAIATGSSDAYTKNRVEVGATHSEAIEAVNTGSSSTYRRLRNSVAGLTHGEALAAMGTGSTDSYIRTRNDANATHPEAIDAVNTGSSSTYRSLRSEIPGATHSEVLEAVRYGSPTTYKHVRLQSGASHSDVMDALRTGSSSSYPKVLAVTGSHSQAIEVLNKGIPSSYSSYRERVPAATHHEAIEAMDSGYTSSYATLRNDLSLNHREALEVARSGNTSSYRTIRGRISVTHSEALEGANSGYSNSYINLREAGGSHSTAMGAIRSGDISKTLKLLKSR